MTLKSNQISAPAATVVFSTRKGASEAETIPRAPDTAGVLVAGGAVGPGGLVGGTCVAPAGAVGGGGAASMMGRSFTEPSRVATWPDSQPTPFGPPAKLMANQSPALLRPMAGTFSPVLMPATVG